MVLEFLIQPRYIYIHIHVYHIYIGMSKYLCLYIVLCVYESACVSQMPSDSKSFSLQAPLPEANATFVPRYKPADGICGSIRKVRGLSCQWSGPRRNIWNFTNLKLSCQLCQVIFGTIPSDPLKKNTRFLLNTNTSPFLRYC